VANTPLLVGFGYPVGWVSCCIIELIYYWVQKKIRSADHKLMLSE
jgi:hypothetical protein